MAEIIHPFLPDNLMNAPFMIFLIMPIEILYLLPGLHCLKLLSTYR